MSKTVLTSFTKLKDEFVVTVNVKNKDEGIVLQEVSVSRIGESLVEAEKLALDRAEELLVSIEGYFRLNIQAGEIILEAAKNDISGTTKEKRTTQVTVDLVIGADPKTASQAVISRLDDDLLTAETEAIAKAKSLLGV